MRSFVVTLALLFTPVAACHKDDPGPPCDKVVDHLLEVTKQALPGHAGMNAFGDKKGMITQCEARKMSKQTRECLMAAKTLDALGVCYPKAPPPAAAPNPAPPPAGSDRGTPPP